MLLQLGGHGHVYQTPTRQGGKGRGGKAGGELRLKDDEEPEWRMQFREKQYINNNTNVKKKKHFMYSVF